VSRPNRAPAHHRRRKPPGAGRRPPGQTLPLPVLPATAAPYSALPLLNVTVARRVGYEDAFAFKRARCVSLSVRRRQCADLGAMTGGCAGGDRAVQKRVRLLPSRVVVYFVLALALFEQCSYWAVWGGLVAGLDALGLARPCVSALCRARRRVGPQAVQSSVRDAGRTAAGRLVPVDMRHGEATCRSGWYVAGTSSRTRWTGVRRGHWARAFPEAREGSYFPAK
jgi:hypothetical protein